MPKAKGKTRRQKFGSRIRHARDRAAAVRQKLAEMELAIRALEVDLEGRPQELVQKPYLVDYIRCMVENHGEDWKAMAQDENYYQDSPEKIQNKINVSKHFYPAAWQAFVHSL